MHIAPLGPGAQARLAGVLLLMVGLLTLVSRSSPASVQISTCQAIGCGEKYFFCGSYRWGGPNPGSRDCYTNIFPGQGN